MNHEKLNQIIQKLFPAWCAITVLEKDIEVFASIVNQLVQGVISQTRKTEEPSFYSTGCVQVFSEVYNRYNEELGCEAPYYSLSVTITTHDRIEFSK